MIATFLFLSAEFDRADTKPGRFNRFQDVFQYDWR